MGPGSADDDAEGGGQTVVRAAQVGDDDAIDDVVGAAFGGPAEVVLVHRIRASDNHVADLELVAQRGDEIVGHTMLSYVGLDDGRRQRRILSLAPLAVSPAAQRQGIGGRLIGEALRRADERGEPLVVLEGSPAYYPRFGFEYAGDHGISIELPSWAPKEAAMVQLLSSYDRDVTGHVVYPPAFDLDDLH